MLLRKFEIENEKDALDNLIQIKNNIKKIKIMKEPLEEMISLDEKAFVLQNITRTTKGISQEMSFWEKKHFAEDENFKILQNIVEFQFFTCVRGYHPSVWKELIKNNEFSSWYKKWLQQINDFRKLDQTSFETITV